MPPRLTALDASLAGEADGKLPNEAAALLLKEATVDGHALYLAALALVLTGKIEAELLKTIAAPSCCAEPLPTRPTCTA